MQLTTHASRIAAMQNAKYSMKSLIIQQYHHILNFAMIMIRKSILLLKQGGSRMKVILPSGTCGRRAKQSKQNDDKKRRSGRPRYLY